MFALAATCAVLLANPPRPRLPRSVRLALVAGAVLVAAAVPVAMVALGYHYFTDIVAGTAVGTGMVLLTALLIDRARPAGGPHPARPRRAPPRSAPVVYRDRGGPEKISPPRRTGCRQHAIEKRWTTMR